MRLSTGKGRDWRSRWSGGAPPGRLLGQAGVTRSGDLRRLAGLPGAAANSPLVSAIVLSYNQARFVLETLDSVRAQSHPRVELIVVDDASTDDSVVRVRAWSAARALEVHILENPANLGICKSLNRALAIATGDFVAPVASDDRWLPNRLEKQLAMLDDGSGRVGLIYSDAYCISETGQRLTDRFIARYRPAGPPKPGAHFEALHEGNFIPAPTALIRRSSLAAVGGYDEALVYEDWDMWLRIAHRYEVRCCDYIGAEYRVRPGSLSEHLHRAPPLAIETNARIARKWCRASGVGPRHRRLWANRLADAAESLFMIRHPASGRVLSWAVMVSPPHRRAKLLTMLLRCWWARSRGRFAPVGPDA